MIFSVWTLGLGSCIMLTFLNTFFAYVVKKHTFFA
jgi:hypothetical protein